MSTPPIDSVSMAYAASDRKKKRMQLLEFYSMAQADKNLSQPIKIGNALSADSVPDAGGGILDAKYDMSQDGFDAHAYMEMLLRTQSLKELLETDSNMMKEIKTLENDMKKLVYKNYTKFITASSAIHEMRFIIGGIEDEIAKLAECVERIDAIGKEARGSLDSKRERMEQLIEIRYLSDGFQRLVALPSQLSRAIANGEYEKAVSCYKKMCSALEKHEDVDCLCSIREECSEIMDRFVSELLKRFYAPDATTEVVGECMSVLLELGHSHSVLMDRYTSMRVGEFEEQRKMFEEQIMSEVEVGSESDHSTTQREDENDLALSERVSDRVKLELKEADTDELPLVEEELDRVVSEEKGRDDASSSENVRLLMSFHEKVLPSFSAFCEIYGASHVRRSRITKEEQREAVFEFDRVVQRLVDEYCHFVRRILTASAPRFLAKTTNAQRDSASNSTGSSCLELLQYSYTGLNTMLSGYWNQVLLSSTPSDLVVEIKGETSLRDSRFYLSSFCSFVIDLHIDALDARLAALMKQNMAAVASVVDTRSNLTSPIIFPVDRLILAEVGIETIRQLVLVFSVCSVNTFLSSSAWPFLAHVKQKMQTFLDRASSLFYQEDDDDASVRPSFFSDHLIRLVLAPLYFEALGSRAAPALNTQFAEMLRDIKQFGPLQYGQDRFINSDQLGKFDRAARLHVTGLVRHLGAHLGLLLRRQAEACDWLNQSPPSRVSPGLDLFLDELDAIECHLFAVYPAGDKQTRKTPLLDIRAKPITRVDAPSLLDDDDAPQLNVPSPTQYMDLTRQLHLKKFRLYPEDTPFTAHTIATAAIRLALKGWLEAVRLQTFGTNGYQQIQVDAYYLNVALDDYVDQPDELDWAISTVVQAAHDRCVDPLSINQRVLSSVCVQHILHGPAASRSKRATRPSPTFITP